MKPFKVTPAMLTLGAAVALGTTAMAVPSPARAACGSKMQSGCSSKSQNSMNTQSNGNKCGSTMSKCGSTKGN